MAFAGNQTTRPKSPFCTIGTLEFKLLTSPKSLSTGYKYNFVEHDRIEGKPTLQQVGGTLRSIDLSFEFHCAFCDPEKQLQGLIDLANKGEAIALVLGDRFQNYWVIEDIPVTWKKCDQEARLLAIEVQVKLKEYIGVVLERKPKQKGFESKDRSTFSGFTPSNIA